MKAFPVPPDPMPWTPETVPDLLRNANRKAEGQTAAR